MIVSVAINATDICTKQLKDGAFAGRAPAEQMPAAGMKYESKGKCAGMAEGRGIL